MCGVAYMTYIIVFEVSFNLWFRVLGLQVGSRIQGLGV